MSQATHTHDQAMRGMSTESEGAGSTIPVSRGASELVVGGEEDASNRSPRSREGDHDSPDQELSPVPSDSISSPGSMNMNSFGDEIIVRARTNGDSTRHSPSPSPSPSPSRSPTSPQAVSDNEDDEMVDSDTEQLAGRRQHKRKRSAAQNEPSSASTDRVANDPIRPNEPAPARFKPIRRPVPGSAPKGALLGYWRDSAVPTIADKHAVIGFTDVKDRLRTQIQSVTRWGNPVPPNFPLPPGPGGAWVAFDRIVFEDHLVGLDQHTIKEYVKVRPEAGHADLTATAQERKTPDLSARAEAITRAKANPLPDSAPTPALAYGDVAPDSVNATPARAEPSVKRRRTSAGFAATSETPLEPAESTADVPLMDPRDPLHGTRPTRVMIGYWRGSSEADPRDRHAVYGILGQNDMFRVKVVRETRDGRYVNGNFPSGAGALWIHYDEVVMEDILQGLNRNEVKEYCRIRQYQMDKKEDPADREANERIAVVNAKHRFGTLGRALRPGLMGTRLSGQYEENLNTDDREDSGRPRPSRRSTTSNMDAPTPPAATLPRRPLPQGPELAERTAAPVATTPKEAGRPEMTHYRTDRQTAERHAAANREAAARAVASAANLHMPLPIAPTIPSSNSTPGPSTSATVNNGLRTQFHESDEMQRLNNVWARQEAQRLRTAPEAGVKVSAGGIKYTLKPNNSTLFPGRYVSPGSIVNIDGEEYVEYRVLTKPS